MAQNHSRRSGDAAGMEFAVQLGCPRNNCAAGRVDFADVPHKDVDRIAFAN
jgi:hypothetical protein